MAFKKYTSGVVNYIVDNYECECSSDEHTIKFKFFLDESMDPKIYVSVHLSNQKGFFNRLIQGVKYIFGHKSKYGNFDEFIFKKEDLDDLKTLIIEYERATSIQ